MEFDVSELGESRVRVYIRLEAAEVDQAFKDAYQALSQRGGIRGFRPGKVPRGILERYYDAEAIRGATYEKLVEDWLREACEQAEVQPIEQVRIELGPPPDEEEEIAASVKAKLAAQQADADEEEMAEEPAEEADEEEDEQAAEEEEIPLVEGQPFEFHTSFMAYPRPKLPEYKGLRLRRPVAEVTEQEIEAQLERLRELNAREVEVDRSAVGEGDLVVVDIAIDLGEGSGGESEEPQAQEQELIVGQREYNPPIDRALIGHIVGQTVELPVEYAEDHLDRELAGKEGTIRATIKSLKGRELPELDDEFAQSLGGYETLAELRESIESQLERANQEYAEGEVREQTLRYLIEHTELEVPGPLLEQAAESGYESFLGDLERMGLSVEGFVEATGMAEETLRANQWARAESALKLHFALQAIAEREGLEVTAEDIGEEIGRYASESGGDVGFVSQAAEVQPGFADELRERVVSRKVVGLMVEAAEIEELSREEYEGTEGEQQQQGGEDSESQAAENEAQESEGD